MKKYVFSILLFLGCFFVSLTINVNKTLAVSETVVVDAYDSRKINVTIEDLSPRTQVINIHEIEYCVDTSDPSCKEVLVGTDNRVIFKILNSVSFEVDMNRTTTAVIDYTVQSSSDGLKRFFVEPMNEGEPMRAYYHIFEYSLSTLNQRIVVNADGNGNPLHVYDNLQYISVRVLPITIELLPDELENTYSGLIYVCEVGNVCRDYELENNLINFSLDSYGDGLKQLNIYLVKKGHTIDSSKLDAELQNDSKVRLISKNVYLDTIGPEISVEGAGDSWVWAYVEAGKKYEVAKAICKDAVFTEDECSVSNDAEIVKINYNTDKYQFVTYEATDRLGNTTSIPVKIKVEIDTGEDNNMGLYLGVSASVLIVTGIILTYVLMKNNEKKKKLSYI